MFGFDLAEGKDETVYWCVVCARPIVSDEAGVFVHDDVPHPDTMTFDDDEPIH